MNGLLSYERLIVQNNPKKRRVTIIGFLCLYLIWALLWFGVMIWVGINAPMIFFIPLTTALLAAATWKYIHVEFEYTLLDGTFCLDKIYGKKKRKSLLEADLKQAVWIAPRTDESQAQAERHSPNQTIVAVSSLNDNDIWLLLFEDPDGNRTLVWVNADDAMLRIFRHYNPRATAKKSEHI